MKNFSSVFVATYTFKENGKRANGANHIQALLDYLKNSVKDLYFLEQPSPLMDDLCPALEYYRFGRFVYSKRMPKFFKFLWTVSAKRKARGGTVFWLKVRDFVSVFYFFYLSDARRPTNKKERGSDRGNKAVSLFIGVESVNSLAGLILKFFGRIKTSVYYVVDFGHQRYKNPLINKIYIWLDKISTYKSDFAVYSSKGYLKLKIDFLGYSQKKMCQWAEVPFAVDGQGINILPEDKLCDLMVFNGSVEEENGVFLIIEAFAEVLKRRSGLRLKIIGGGPLENQVKKRINELKIGNSVEMTGYFFDKEEIRKDFCRAKIGLAPYVQTKASMKAYGDPIKLKEYMACGLPVITTNIPVLSEYIAKKPAGIVFSGGARELAEAMVKLLNDSDFYGLCRKNALDFSKQNSWDKNFERAFNVFL